MMFWCFERFQRMVLLRAITLLLICFPLLETDSYTLLAADNESVGSGHEQNAVQNEIAAVLRDRCVHCHGESDEVMGDVDLVAFLKHPARVAEPELLQDLIRVVDLGEMPPEEEGELTLEVQLELVKALRSQFTLAVA